MVTNRTVQKDVISYVITDQIESIKKYQCLLCPKNLYIANGFNFNRKICINKRQMRRVVYRQI